MASRFRTGLVDEADLHSFADGQLEGDRRDAVVLHLRASPGDRARVEAWQGQNNLLRSAFSHVEREPLPALLDLTAKTRLQCIPANDAPLVDPSIAQMPARRRAAAIGTSLATLFVVAAGLGSAWLLLDPLRNAAGLNPVAEKTVEATVVSDPATVGRSDPSSLAGIHPLPTSAIPDLGPWGFRFTGAEASGNAATIDFRYVRGKDLVEVKVSRAKAANVSPPVQTRDGYAWHTEDAEFAVTGTVQRAVLREIAAGLHKGVVRD